MRGLFKTVGKLKVLKRLNNSLNGNPRYWVLVGDCAFCTPVDSSFGYSITNYEGKEVEVEIGIHYNNPTLNAIKEV